MTVSESSGSVGRSAAFFDIDKTLVPGSSLYPLARRLRHEGVLGTGDAVRFAASQLVFRGGGRERRGAAELARRKALAFVAGRNRDELRSWARAVVSESLLPHVYPAMEARIRSHREAGEPVWLLTASPLELAEILAEGLGATGALGTEVEVDDAGVCTGRLAGPLLHGQPKADAVVALAASERLDLSRVSAYSDSVHDLPLLSLVGRPHAVNPDTALRRHARRHGWPVVELRRGRRAVVRAGVSTLAGSAVAGGGVAVVVAGRRTRTRPSGRDGRPQRRRRPREAWAR